MFKTVWLGLLTSGFGVVGISQLCIAQQPRYELVFQREQALIVASSNAFSPDGKALATGLNNGVTIIWDAHSGRISHTLRGHKDMVYDVAYSADGRQLLTGSGDSTAILWDVTTGRKRRTFDCQGKSVFSVAYFSEGGVLATGAGDETVLVWNAKTGEKLHTLESGSYALAFSPDGAQLLAGGGSLAPHAPWGVAMLWDARTGKLVRNFAPTNKEGFYGAVVSVEFSSDGDRIACGSFDASAAVFDTTSGKERRIVHTSHAVRSVDFSRDAKKLITVNERGLAEFWDVESGKQLGDLSDCGHSAKFSPDDLSLLSGRFTATTSTWDAATFKRRRVLVAKVVLPESSDDAELGDIIGCAQLCDDDGHEIGQLFSHSNGLDWLFVTLDGDFEGTDNMIREFKVRGLNNEELIELEELREKYYRSGLLDEKLQ